MSKEATSSLSRLCRPAIATRHTLPLVGLACGLFLLGGGMALAVTGTSYTVSQRGRQFNPGMLNLKRGQIVHIVNDDEDLLHHAYIESEKFNFDSGDQEPGSSADITFTVSGDFKVLCGIHPKMKLLVHVE